MNVQCLCVAPEFMLDSETTHEISVPLEITLCRVAADSVVAVSIFSSVAPDHFDVSGICPIRSVPIPVCINLPSQIFSKAQAMIL